MLWCFRLTGSGRWPTSSRGRATKKGLYLQIYESHWDPKRRHTANRSVKTLSAKERTWALSGDGWTDVADGKGETSFRYKMADGDFEYTVEGEDGRKRKVELLERRVVTYSPISCQEAEIRDRPAGGEGEVA